MDNLSKYIGRKYEECNCFDLAKEFYKDNFGLVLRDYFEGEVPARKEIECLVKTNKGEFISVATPEFGDLIVVCLYGYASHIGVFLGKGKFLHTKKITGSCIESVSKYSRMIEGYYRHREAAQ